MIMAPFDEKGDDASTTASQFAAIVDPAVPTPITVPPVSPRVDFMSSPEVKQLSETQKTARAKAQSMLMFLKTSKR